MTRHTPGVLESLVSRIRRWFSGRPDSVEPGPTTPSQVTAQPADTPLGQPGRNQEDRLDEALQETMPTSDPISVRIE